MLAFERVSIYPCATFASFVDRASVAAMASKILGVRCNMFFQTLYQCGCGATAMHTHIMYMYSKALGVK